MASVPKNQRTFPSFLSFVIMRCLPRFASGVVDGARKCMALLLVYATVAGTMPVRADELATSYSPSRTRQSGWSNTVDGAWPLRSGLGVDGKSRSGADFELTSVKPASTPSAEDLGAHSQPTTANAGAVSSAIATSAGPKAAVTPLLECIVNSGKGDYEAWFGYQNDGDTSIAIPLGADNRFSSPTE